MSAAANTLPAVSIRPAWPEDQPFVTATMADQMSQRNHKDAHSVVNRIFESERVRVLVATRGSRIIGWLAYSPIPRVRALIFAYVRKDDRGRGVARSLADTAWPSRRGQWIHPGLRGGATKSLLERFSALSMNLEELI